MVTRRHPLSGTNYERIDGRRVRVEGNGTTGVFDRDGRWLEGERRTADPEMCRFVADGPVPLPGAPAPDAGAGS
jgi:hypothetical protein